MITRPDSGVSYTFSGFLQHKNTRTRTIVSNRILCITGCVIAIKSIKCDQFISMDLSK